ncbi:hypothetical protein [Acinetobacter sp. TSRC1-2]|uniref:hypothetical protein n=1 Tax=unclassified Acinetobacter TaxID=196816 RepID=UPI003CF35355
MKITFKNIKNFFQDERTQVALNEIKTLVREKPSKFMLDAFTLFGEAKSFQSHLIIGNPVFNQLGLHRFRVQKAAQLAQKRRQYLAQFIAAEDVEQFQQNGFILKENFLSDAEFNQLKQELLETKFETRETLQGDTVTRRMSLDHQVLN